MRYHNITKADMLNGDGLRVVLWVAGCSHRCGGCHNPVTWDIQGGVLFDEETKQELFAELDKSFISGVTFSGGDPLHPQNRPEIGRLIYEIADQFPQKTIWLYTGYRWEEISELPYIKKIHVVVDGKFDAGLKETKLRWKGSSNQRVIDVQKSLKAGSAVLHKS